MNKLVSIEMKKVFKHKSIYIIYLVIFAFCLLNYFLYKNDYDSNGFYKYEVEDDLVKYVKKLELDNKKYDVNKDSDKSIFVTNKTKIDIARIRMKYDVNDWRYIKAKDYLYECIYDYNYYKYIVGNFSNANFNMENYNDRLLKFKKNDWLFFAKEERAKIKDDIVKLDNYISNTNDVEEIKKLNLEKKNLNNKLLIVNYRINKKINYSNTFLNKAVINYEDNIDAIDDNKIIKRIDYQQKIKKQEEIRNHYINKYIIDNKINIDKVNTLNYQLRTIVDDYEFFIILIILVVSGILICEEFNKGTIKLLLIKPYSRNQILISKLVACFYMFLLTIIFIFLSHLFIGGILFGFSSLKNGVIVYDFNLHKLLKINIFVYVLLRIVVKMPMFLIIIIISFIFGIILNSTVGSFAITMIIYSFSEVINKLAIDYNLKFMKYFITLNWNLKDYLFGGISLYQFLDCKKSILILLFYGIILVGILFLSFNNKNIKNI